MKKIKIILFFFFIHSVFIFSQTVTPIADLKQNDSQGIPINIGKTYTITGIVTSSNQFGNSGPGSIQDATGGISVYGSGFANSVNIGDSVTVTAVLDQYRGLTQLSFGSSSKLIKHTSGNNVEPLVVTIDQIINQQWNGFEEIESKLIRINNVSFQESGSFTGGTNYTLSDGSSSMELRIDESVNIVGTAIPSGKFDVIGILGQYKYSAPYNSGYQLLPRSISDILDNGAPLILSPVLAADIDTSSFTVYFNTAKNGNSEVRYGLTSSLELGSVIIQDDTTVHKVKISGLKPATLYYFKALSSNAQGSSESGLKTVTTASSNPLLGKINIYFNFPVDTSVAIHGNAANGNVDFQEKLIERINSANFSIDMALYSFFGMSDVANALIVAKDRGVKIRVVYDDRTMQNSMQMLVNAGIKISQRPPASSSFPGIMHNKFFIFDARDTVAANDWLWTGSWNVTSTEMNWKNNIVEINDPTITKAYQIEFEEMWGSNTNVPDPANAKFGKYKSDNTPHNFTIGGKDVKVYFSPSDGTTGKIINAVDSADQSIYLALYVFTRDDIQIAIANRNAAGVTDIRGVITDVNANGSEFYKMTYAEMLQNPAPVLHSKYSIIDASFPMYSPLTITGSHNWSSAAENNNDENTLFISDPYIANQYMQDFKARYNEAGGKGTFIVPTDVKDDLNAGKLNYTLYQNYPNPFNPITTIRFEVPFSQKIKLEVFDILGNKVKTLFNAFAPAGIIAVDFDAGNLASGVYIYRLYGKNFTASKKFILLK